MENMVFNVAEPADEAAVIKVFGIGGGGCNAINNMIANALKGVEFISANTDVQSLKQSKAPKKIQLGKNLTHGLGAGANPEVGRKAAMEDHEAIKDVLKNANMVFITTGMGGGTGTGAAPVVAEIAREMGILTVAVVTRPFTYEGSKRMKVAQEGVGALKEHVDSLIVIPNDKLLDSLGRGISLTDAFQAADSVLCSAVAGVSEIVTCPGLVNVDFNDVKNIMSITGVAMMGSSQVSGEDRARLATEQAIASPLLDNISLEGARGVLVNISTAPGGLTIDEYGEVMSIVSDYADDNAELKFGTAEIADMPQDAIRVTLIATGLQEKNQSSHERLKIVHAATGTDAATGSDDGFDLGSVTHSGRGSRRSMLTAEDFQNQSILDSMEMPAVIRRQAD